MFSGPRFLAYVHKPSLYYLRKSIPDERRKEIIKQLSDMSTRAIISGSNPLYRRAN